MKKKLLFILATATLAASCSKDRVIYSEQNQNSNLIGFDTYKSITKGNPIDNNIEFLTKGNKFSVTAFISTAEAPYMGTLNEGVGIISNGISWEYDNPAEQAYWPVGSETLNFFGYFPYAHSSISNKIFSKTTGISFDYTVPATESEQIDLMFASALNQTKPSGVNSILIPFKHALTQIHFKVATKTERLRVDIQNNGISIHNIMSAASFTLPTSDSDNGWSAWSMPNDYTVTNGAITGTFVGYGTTESPYKYTQIGDENHALMLIPQIVSPWVPIADANIPEIGEQGAYLRISCKIYQMLDATEKVYLVGSENSFDDVYIPFSSQKDGVEVWNRSKNVSYNLMIGGGTTLNPIEFETSVQDWIPVDGGTIENQ